MTFRELQWDLSALSDTQLDQDIFYLDDLVLLTANEPQLKFADHDFTAEELLCDEDADFVLIPHGNPYFQ